MRVSKGALTTAVICCAVLAVSGQALGQEIAGLAPSVRPPSAPILTEYPKNRAWYEAALIGVEQPYPASLRFLEDQGAWFTPFIHPGMTGPYDIRRRHAGEPQPNP